MKIVIGMLGAAIAVAASLPGAARAGIEDIQVNSNPTGLCQGALPSFDTSLRKRPLAVKNEGSSDAFVTCSFTTLQQQSGSNSVLAPDVVSYFGAFFANSGSVDQTVSCTAVVGYENDPDVLYISKQALVKAGNVPGGSDDGFLFFYPEDADQTRFYQMVSMSCRLPAGVAINDTYVGQWLDDATTAPAD